MNVSTVSFLFKDFDLFQKAYEIRKTVFIDEQKVSPQEELDGLDAGCIHFLIFLEEKAIGTGRLRYINANTMKVERIAILKEFRKNGYGIDLMKAIEEKAKIMKIKNLTMNAQLYAKKFYERLGYKADGEVFEEAGIKHIKMTKEVI
ncbi:N-acetyltransferase [Tepiditoga spiralis]|uniref:N-acetyltransferase n=1 Tax=Tepiditoga spiralis TaxID=2108365 RepID=A0A7G1GBY1_9BACT|nr:GNAT family N-acetyltransferase [Tepiditoga spiralis]BBE32082.1 N-acetyltransferase [Tepiditoga spiralis]